MPDMIQWWEKWNVRICIMVITITFIAGIFVSNDYGCYIDEYTEKSILWSNVREYIYIFRGEEIREDGISHSVERDHGVAPYYPLGAYWAVKMHFGEMEFLKDTAEPWRIYTFTLFFCGCMALYGIVYELIYSKKTALFTFLMYYLTPRIFAEGHYNNKDIIFLTFGIITLYFAIRYIKSRSFGWGFCFACAAAFMTNIKIPGLWFFAAPGIAYLCSGFWERKLDRRRMMEGFGVILSYFVIFTVITPAFLSGGADYIEYCLTNATSFARWFGVVVYAGKTVNIPKEQLPPDYLPLNILYTTPLVILLLSLIGHVKAVAAIVRKEKGAALYGMVLVLYLVPFGYALANRNLIAYNGWRHFYFLYGGIAIFMAAGCHTIFRILKRRWLTYGFCGCVLVYLLYLIIAGHPYQYAYINILARRPAEMDWQLDYWDMGALQALDRLYSSKDRNQALELSVAGEDTINQYMLYDDRWNGEISCKNRNDAFGEVNYIIYNKTYGSPPETGYHLLFTIEAYGNCLYEVYEKDEKMGNLKGDLQILKRRVLIDNMAYTPYTLT